MERTIPRRPKYGPALIARIHQLMTERVEGGGYRYTYREVAQMTGVSMTTLVRIERARREAEGDGRR